MELPFPKFLNVLYSQMIKRLPPWEEGKPDPRKELDSKLGIINWQNPWEVKSKVTKKALPSNAPSWWGGDLEASQSFIAAMGVRLD